MLPKVSVIVPVYNCEKYLSKCLESIINQIYKNIEIIIINDGSTDGSGQVVKHFKEMDIRIIYYEQTNSGPSEARNRGISLSTGDYLVFVDSDDTVDKRYVELLLTRMIKTGSDLVCCGYVDISEYGVINCTDFEFESSVSTHEIIDMVCKRTGGVLWGKIFRREIIVKYGIKMDKDIFMSEDLVFVLQYVVRCSSSFTAINENLYHYNRLNQDSISSNISTKYLENFIAVCKHLEQIFLSVNLGNQEINQIIGNRIQNIIVSNVEMLSMKIKDHGMKQAINDIDYILSIPYIKKYQDKFEAQNWIYKPYIFFLRNRHIKSSIQYGMFINVIKNINRNFKKRKNVGL
ncbi:glycosyltransferase family 2 protein [Metabacillus sp. 84]|uniref:glycosyltransferase family 2 protein n=1 Tax=unclassified Metabacillus TaxID=2675274 RepID=UPI003CEB5252